MLKHTVKIARSSFWGSPVGQRPGKLDHRISCFLADHLSRRW